MSDYAGGVTGHSGNWSGDSNTTYAQPQSPSSPGPSPSSPGSPTGPGTGSTNMYYGTGTAKPNVDPAYAPNNTPTVSDAPPLYGGNAASGGDARAQITDYLGQYGLGDLGSFAWNEYVSGVPLSQIFLDIRSQPAFKARFPALDALAAKGHAISPAEYVSLERQYTTVLRSAGLPQGFYDQPADFTNWIAGEVSPTEIQDRVQQGFLKVQMAPVEVRQAFAQYFGADGDQALAAFFLDPNKAEPQLVQMADAAIVGGTGKRFGFDINLSDATRLAQLGVTAASAEQGFQKIGDLSPIFHETVGETQDYTASREGIGAVFGTDEAARNALDVRLQQRRAAFAGDANAGPQLTSTGSSIGSART